MFLIVRGVNYSVEFTGGTLIQVQTAANVSDDAIRGGLEAAGIKNPEIQRFGTGNEFMIRARVGDTEADANNTQAAQQAVNQALTQVVGQGKFTIIRTEAVGAKVGGELQRQAFLAIFLSFFAVLAYLAYRFEWRFGLAAVVATAHDILTTVAFMAAMKLEVSLVVVAAFLTMVGYSLNDTIIIFDRVRENLHKHRRDDFVSILNRSINETLPRSILTHGTTLATLLALAIFGGEVIRPFVAGHVLRRVHRHLLVDLHRRPGPPLHRAAVAGSGRPGAAGPGPGHREHRSPAGPADRPLTPDVGPGMPALVDTHCHLADAAFEADVGPVLDRAEAAGVGHVIAIGETPEAAARALALTQDPRVSATAGLHPHEARRWSPALAAWLATAARDERVVALGEMGLDYHYDHSPRDRQATAFEAQLELAREAGKPAVVHARDADADVIGILRNHPRTTVVMHSYSSGPALLEAAVGLGHYVSLSGMVTFKSWRLDGPLRAVPLDRLLVETDAPYLAPVPHRGHRNEPAFVAQTARRLALVMGTTDDEIARRTTENAARVFGRRVAPHPSPTGGA